MFIEISNIKKSYGIGESKVDVLKGISTGIEKGEFCVLLGPSGSGKSTLLNIIGGIYRCRLMRRCFLGSIHKILTKILYLNCIKGY